MTVQELVRTGRLADAVAAQTQEVKAQPGDRDRRFQLFVLLAFAGELERAELQLEALAHQDSRLELGSATYRHLLASELERRKVHGEGRRPVLPPDPPREVGLRLEAVACRSRGDRAGAERALEQAVEAGGLVHGKLNGEAFEGLRDYDDFLGPVLEVYAGGRCLWLPLERIRKLEVPEPRTQLDLLWAPAELHDASGEHASVHLPVLYEGSFAHASELVRLGRSTEWIDCEVGFRGAGQKILLSAQGEAERETALLGVRTLEIEAGPAEAEA